MLPGSCGSAPLLLLTVVGGRAEATFSCDTGSPVDFNPRPSQNSDPKAAALDQVSLQALARHGLNESSTVEEIQTAISELKNSTSPIREEVKDTVRRAFGVLPSSKNRVEDYNTKLIATTKAQEAEITFLQSKLPLSTNSW